MAAQPTTAKKPRKRQITAHKGHGKSSIREIAKREKRKQALELRKAGYDYETIAKQLGYADKSGAYRAIMVALKEITKDVAEDVLQLHQSRLNDMRAAIWGKARKGDVKAIYAVVKIDEREAKLLGINAPEKIAGPDGGPIPFSLADLTDEQLNALETLGKVLEAQVAAKEKTDT